MLMTNQGKHWIGNHLVVTADLHPVKAMATHEHAAGQGKDRQGN